jgi:hypothetical protein
MSGPTKRSPREQETDELILRFDDHIDKWYPNHADRTKFLRDYTFIIGGTPHEIWKCDFKMAGSDKSAPPEETIWFLENGKERTSHNELSGAVVDFVNEKKEERIKSKLKLVTSPLAIGALIAILLVLLIFFLMLRRDGVPDQLWTVFTAVVAFYFGRRGSTSIEDCAFGMPALDLCAERGLDLDDPPWEDRRGVDTRRKLKG